jgi:hypothetical protein
LVGALFALSVAIIGSGMSAWSQSPRSAQAGQLDCAASPHACGFPDATNTGVQPGVALAASPGIAVTHNNQVVQNLSIRNGTIDIQASNVVIRNVKIVIDSPEMWAIIVRPGASATIEHADISGVDARGHSVEYAVLSQTRSAVRIDHANLHNCSACVQGENVTATANYVHDVGGDAGSTGIQCSSNAGCGLTATGNTVLSSGTAIGLFGDFGTPRNSTVDRNLLGGGTFAVYAGTRASTNIHINNNRFSPARYSNGGRSNPIVHYYPNAGNTLVGNVWDDTGKPLSCPGCTSGPGPSPSSTPTPTGTSSTTTPSPSSSPSSSQAPSTSRPPISAPTTTAPLPQTSSAPPSTSSPTPPAPVPPGAVGCAASPHTCGFPDATNTGVQAGVTLTPSGSVFVRQDNQVVQNLSISNGTIDISAKNVTIRNVRITRDSPVLWAIIVRGGASAKIDHVEIAGVDGGSHSVEYGVLSQTQLPVEVSNSHMWQCQDCIQGSYGLYAHDNFLEDNAYVPGAHLDGFQCDGEGGCHVTVRHNTVFGTGIALALYGDFGTPANSTFDDNLVRGGSYSIYGGISSSTGIHITNNRIARSSQFPKGGIWGPFGYCFPSAPGAIFSGNVWDDTGQPVEP